MKKLIKLSLIALLISLMVVFAFAVEEDDSAYYDVNGDGKIEVIDALGVLREVINGDGELLRVVRTLKLVTSGKVVEAIITEMNMETQTATIFCEGSYRNVPMKKIAFDKNYRREFYHTGAVTMTVTDDFTVCAASATCRYDISEIHLTAGSPTALVNGKEQTLLVNPMVRDGVLMINADFLAEKLELAVSWDNTTNTAIFKDFENVLEMTLDDKNAKINENAVVLDAAMTTIDNRTYVSAAFVAEAFGAKATYYADVETLVIVKRFLPTFSATDIVATAGEEASITLTLAHNPGVAGMQFNIEYDKGAMSYTSAKNVSNGMYTAASQSAGANPFKFVAANLSLKEVKGDLTLATVNFAVSDTASGTYPLVFKEIKIYSVFGDEIYKMDASVENATVTVK